MQTIDKAEHILLPISQEFLDLNRRIRFLHDFIAKRNDSLFRNSNLGSNSFSFKNRHIQVEISMKRLFPANVEIDGYAIIFKIFCLAS